MPRFARLDAPGVPHHVIGRGIEKKEILSTALIELPHEKMTLDLQAFRVCEVHGVQSGEPLSGGRRREMIEARRVMSWLSVKALGYLGAKVARYLGGTSSCVTGAASSGEAPDTDKYL